MKMLVFAVFDVKVDAYASPFFMRSKGEAIRSFEQACADDKLPFKAFPRDYRLFFLGEFDDARGVFDSSGPEALIGAAEFVQSS